MKKKLQKPEVKGKPATILYKRMPEGVILITGFENFLTADELVKKFGEEIANIYLAYPNHMEKKFYTDGTEHIVIGCNDEDDISVDVGDVCPRKGFSQVVDCIRKAGTLLHVIIGSQDNEIKRIRI